MAMRSLLTAALLLPLAAGCVSHRTQPAATRPAADQRLLLAQPAASADQVLRAQCVPPAEWKPREVAPSHKAKREVWFSPTGDTAYGVIYFALPLPIGTELAFRGFLAEMRKREGDARLLEKHKDEKADALRFVAEMPQYQMRGKLIIRGMSAWVVFASTVTGRPVHADELAQAESAREATRPLQ